MAKRLSEALYRLAIALWIGGMVAVGYVAVPVLFATLDDRQLAGVVAGRLFALSGWVGLALAAYLLAFLAARWQRQLAQRAVFWLTLLIAACVALSLFGIQPLMAQMKADALPLDVMHSALRGRFVAWHGISSVLYLAQSLLGLWLVLWSDRGLR